MDSLGVSAQDAADIIDARTEKFRTVQASLIGNCRRQIREQPVVAVGSAVAAGFLLNILLGHFIN